MHRVLEEYSPQAAASFLQDRGGGSKVYVGISADYQANNWYRDLILGINSLRDVMEKPDVYF